MTPFTPGELTSSQAQELNRALRVLEQFSRLTVAAPLSMSRAAGIPAIRLEESALNIPASTDTETFLVQITAKCMYDGSDTRDADGFTPTGDGLNCAPDLDCLGRYIQYSWTRVVESEPAGCPLTYTEVDPKQEGGPQCFPLIHIANNDLPVYPASSPRSHFAGAAEDDDAAGDVAWLTPANAEGDADGSYATCSLADGETTHYLSVSGFCFNLAGNATITNVEVKVTAHADGSNVTDAFAFLTLDGTTMSDNKTAGATLGTSDGVQSFSFDLTGWNWLTLNPLKLNKSGFGFIIGYTNGSGAARIVSVDSVEIVVSFTPAGVTIPRHAVVRVWKGEGDWYLFDQLPWLDILRRTDDEEADGTVSYLRYYDQNAGEWRDGEQGFVVVSG